MFFFVYIVCGQPKRETKTLENFDCRMLYVWDMRREPIVPYIFTFPYVLSITCIGHIEWHIYSKEIGISFAPAHWFIYQLPSDSQRQTENINFDSNALKIESEIFDSISGREKRI